MSIDHRLLEILCCPRTRVSLARSSKDLLADLNARQRAGTLRYADGSTVEQVLDDALVTVDQRWAYRVEDGIPVLLPEQAMTAQDHPGQE